MRELENLHAPTMMKEITIEAGQSGRRYWHDLWDYRELFWFLAWRDLLVRYKQTVIGVSWALIRPMVTMVVLTLVFGKLAKLDSGGVPYPLLVLCGMLPWQFFASAFSDSGHSLVTNSGMISKVYFPRLIVPASSLITSLADFVIAAGLLAILMMWYGHAPGAAVLWLPAFVILAIATAFGAGLWVAALMVRYRDFRFIVPFVVQLGLYVSPVGFGSRLVPEEWRNLYSFNPMTGVIEGFRWTLLGTEPPQWQGLLVSSSVVAVLVVTGLRYFRRTERSFADVI
jgi:lipopolysaccharide transport system permease protein